MFIKGRYFYRNHWISNILIYEIPIQINLTNHLGLNLQRLIIW